MVMIHVIYSYRETGATEAHVPDPTAFGRIVLKYKKWMVQNLVVFNLVQSYNYKKLGEKSQDMKKKKIRKRHKDVYVPKFLDGREVSMGQSPSVNMGLSNCCTLFVTYNNVIMCKKKYIHVLNNTKYLYTLDWSNI